MEEGDAVGEGFGGEVLEADGAMDRLNEGDAFADEEGRAARFLGEKTHSPKAVPVPRGENKVKGPRFKQRTWGTRQTDSLRGQRR